ncbi:hypothetical protein Hanom_Chr08g00727711 [Helianthus anomalus]
MFSMLKLFVEELYPILYIFTFDGDAPVNRHVESVASLWQDKFVIVVDVQTCI